jgi:hypothetical protein
MDLAVRSSPSGSDWAGSKLLVVYHVQFNTLVLANAATSFIVLPFVLVKNTQAGKRFGSSHPSDIPAAPRLLVTEAVNQANRCLQIVLVRPEKSSQQVIGLEANR